MEDREAGTTSSTSPAKAAFKRPAVQVLLVLLVLAAIYGMATGYLDGARTGYGL